MTHWEQYQKAVGARVREERVRRGWDQGQLSRRTAVGIQPISRVERGRATPLEVLLRLAKAFDLDVRELLPPRL